MEEWADPALSEEWDNVGLLLGDAGSEASRILVALDTTENVVTQAVTGGYDFIITHHPLIYNPLKRITADDLVGSKILRLIQNKTGLYCAHTNLDTAEGGVNDILFDSLGLTEKGPLMETGLGRVGRLPQPMAFKAFIDLVKERLNLPELRFAGSPETLIYKAGLCGGDASAPMYWQKALEKNCQAYITGDLRYHGTLEATERGLNLIDITHYMSEKPIIQAIVNRLAREAEKDGVNISLTAVVEKNVMTIT
jgi:dinuclear metal center YbgI/SA1388 family protein